jgi:hypothetical protein
MNEKLNVPSITIFEQAPGQFMAKSHYSDEQTAAILLNLAINFVRQDERIKFKKRLEKNGAIVSPHTGQLMKPVKGN